MYRITLANHEEATVPMMQGDTDYVIEVTTHEPLKYMSATVDVNTISGNVLKIPHDKVKVDEENNTITWTVDTQTTALAGEYKAQITTYKTSDPDKLVSYYPLILSVSPSIKPIDNPYEEAISEVRELVETGYKEAESWAHGGTGTREGEDTDNSKYYSELAKSAYQDISDTNEAIMSNRIGALEAGYTLNQILIGTIKHDLNKYPSVKVFKGTYGAGIIVGGGAGGSEIQKVAVNYFCEDRNTIRLYVDKHVLYDQNGRIMNVERINKMNDTYYTVTFRDGAIYDLQIVLDDVSLTVNKTIENINYGTDKTINIGQESDIDSMF